MYKSSLFQVDDCHRKVNPAVDKGGLMIYHLITMRTIWILWCCKEGPFTVESKFSKVIAVIFIFICTQKALPVITGTRFGHVILRIPSVQDSVVCLFAWEGWRENRLHVRMNECGQMNGPKWLKNNCCYTFKQDSWFNKSRQHKGFGPWRHVV